MTIARRVLVAGAGVAGLSVAYWLTRHGFSVTVIERLPFVPAMGRNVHVREPGREVLRRMGLERDIAALGFDEPVNVFVDAEGRSIVRLSMAGNAQPQREMLRGDLIRLFQRTLDDRVEFRVHEEIASLQQDSEHVVVQFRHGRCGSYDLVVVAEGSRSATRDLVFVQEADVRDLDVAMAVYPVPKTMQDHRYALQYNATGRRSAILKPAPDEAMTAILGIAGAPGGMAGWELGDQAALFRERFRDLGWQVPRLIADIGSDHELYVEAVRQVRMPRWSRGRVILCGEAASTSSALTGWAATLAIVGGYVLAGELSTAPSVSHAASSYERIMRPLAAKGQGLNKLVTKLMWPRIGITIPRSVLRIVGSQPVSAALSWKLGNGERVFPFSDYGLP